MDPELEQASVGDGKENLRLWLRFLKTSRMIEAQLRQNLKRDFDTTLPRFDVMVALSRYPDGLKMSELSGLLRVSNGNVTGIIDRLAVEGLAERTAVPGDRRAFRVCLTGKGQIEFQRQAVAHKSWIDELLQDVTPEEATALETRLLSFNQALEERSSQFKTVSDTETSARPC
ncbi:MarR family winged helix-turn-helix transcriptional regulator [Ruegeria atlantica]|uniref:MarR family winged helix-turn-helix transcriptional regulator n=1 Tax=Ruegeria atlantica TaxID=81569 RepID=UPI0020C232C5|nr:MarR family transcriptional regulator [Ruegeria atlantica]